MSYSACVTRACPTRQCGEHGGEGVEFELVHDAEAGTLFNCHQDSSHEEQREVQELCHDAQPQHT